MSRVNYTNQHLLKNEKIAEIMTFLSDIGPEDICLEIGPGRGILTKCLVKDSKKVITIESDTSMKQYLEPLAAEFNNLQNIYGNALNIKWPKVDRIISNIPFNITEPLVEKLFQTRLKYASLLVGEKFKNELDQVQQGNPRSRLALLTDCYFNYEPLLEVSSADFNPEPSTDGYVIGLKPIKKSNNSKVANYLLRSIWDQKTKPLGDSLTNAIQNMAVNKFKCQGMVHEKSLIKKLELSPEILRKRTSSLSNYEIVNIYNKIRKNNFGKKMGKAVRKANERIRYW